MSAVLRLACLSGRQGPQTPTGIKDVYVIQALMETDLHKVSTACCARLL